MSGISETIGIRHLGNSKSYIVSWQNRKQGVLSYTKLETPASSYEVGYDSNGRGYCTCKGFQFRSSCIHLTDFLELAPSLTDLRPQTSKTIPRYPRELFLDAVRKIEDRISKTTYRTLVAGSFRRGAAMIRDLDFVTNATTDSVIEEFRSDGINVTVQGQSVCRFDIGDTVSFQVDVLCTDLDCFGSALLHATGSREFNIYLRQVAKSLGLKLNRHGLFHRDDNLRVAGATEEEVLRCLGFGMVPPSERCFDSAVKEQPWRVHKI